MTGGAYLTFTFRIVFLLVSFASLSSFCSRSREPKRSCFFFICSRKWSSSSGERALFRRSKMRVINRLLFNVFLPYHVRFSASNHFLEYSNHQSSSSIQNRTLIKNYIILYVYLIGIWTINPLLLSLCSTRTHPGSWGVVFLDTGTDCGTDCFFPIKKSFIQESIFR